MSINWSDCTGIDLSNPAVLLVVGTIIVVSSLGVWTYRHKSLPGSTWFTCTNVAMIWWLISVGFELSAISLECKVFWAQMPWFGMVLLPTFWSFFLYEYALSKTVPRRVIIVTTLLLPTFVSLLAITNSSHLLFYTADTKLIADSDRPYVIYGHGPIFFLAIFYLYCLIMTSVTIAGRAVWGASSAVRSFFLKLFMTTMIPVITNVFYVFGGLTIFGMDPTPFSFVVSIAMFVWLIADDRWVDTNRIARELLFYNSEDLNLVIDNSGKLLEANFSALQLIGNKPVKKNGLFVIEGVSDILNDLVRNHELPKDSEVKVGDTHFVARKYRISLGKDRKRIGWVVSFVDITDQKHAANLAKEAERMQSQFLATVSHELRTPLTVISGSLQLLTYNKENLTPEQAERLIVLTSRNTTALVKLVNDLLDTQRLESSEFQLNLGIFDLRHILSDAIANLENYKAAKNIRLCYEAFSHEVKVLGDNDRLQQVIVNVVSNAIKFSNDNSDVQISLSIQGGSALILVKDSGRGIPPNSETKVFERFAQIDTSDSKNVYGSGLGMHISQQIMLQHGGDIIYDSALGVGSTFSITLPLSN